MEESKMTESMKQGQEGHAALAEAVATPVAPPREVKTFTVPDERDEYLPALLAEMEHRLLTVKDFPSEGEALEWPEQRQLIVKSLELAARKPAGSRERAKLEEQAHLLAIPCGCPRRFNGGYRIVPGLKLWLRLMDKKYPVPAVPQDR